MHFKFNIPVVMATIVDTLMETKFLHYLCGGSQDLLLAYGEKVIDFLTWKPVIGNDVRFAVSVHSQGSSNVFLAHQKLEIFEEKHRKRLYSFS